MSRLDELSEINPDALLCDGLEEAFVGYTVGIHGVVAVYDYDKAIRVFADTNGIGEEEAREFIDYNTVSAYVGKHTPVFVRFTHAD